jgi:hypothetical protein
LCLGLCFDFGSDPRTLGFVGQSFRFGCDLRGLLLLVFGNARSDDGD